MRSFAECARLGHCWPDKYDRDNEYECRHCPATRTQEWRVEEPAEPKERTVAYIDSEDMVMHPSAEVPSDG